jgi:HSP20 family protein
MNNLVKIDPFADLQALQRQFFGDDWFTTPMKTLQMPTTDVYTEDDKQLVIEAHLPNFEEKDVDVHLDGNALVVSAERHEQEKDKKKKYVVRESSSSFYRRVQLPQVADKDAIEAHIKDGVLTVKVPFKELPAPKKIAILKK